MQWTGKLMALLAVAVLLGVCSQALATPYSSLVLADNPHGYWRMGEGAGLVAVDASTPSLNGNYGQFSPPDGLPTLGVSGIAGAGLDTAVQFNGATPVSQVYVADGAQPTDYTLEAWVKVDPGTTTTPVALINRTVSDPMTSFSHSLGINAAGQFEHYTWDGSARFVRSTTLVQPDEWYHVVGVYHPDLAGTTDSMAIYVNGVVEQNWTGNLNNPWNGGNQWRFAAPSGRFPNWLDGVMDEVAIYLYALSPEQVLAHYQAGVVPEPATFAVWGLGLLGLVWYRRKKR